MKSSKVLVAKLIKFTKLKRFLFIVLPLQIGESESHVFIKSHRSEKKLVVHNIKPYITEKVIGQLFTKAAGQIDKIILTEKGKGESSAKYQIKSEIFSQRKPFKYQKATLIFKKSESLDQLLKSSELPPLNCDGLVTGIAKWTEEHNKLFVDKEEMQKEIEEYMKHYDKVKLAEEMNENSDGDEGWTVVGKGKDGFQQKQSTINKLEEKMRNQKKKTKNLTNFYSFEFKESRKQELMELRKKFENDKLKMQSIKLNRKFRPY